MVISVRPIPGAGFIAGLVVSTWLDAASPVGSMAWILIAHPPPRRPGESTEGIETSLRSMADALGLRAASGRIPVVGDRLSARGAHLVLDYGHPEFCLRVPRPSARWTEHALGGGHVCLVLGLDAIAPGAGPDVIERYLCRATARDRILLGATAVHHR
ncbi:hypothetical protein [Streptomyces rimosus]|uniref:hypothetical protein n=1 Tax=Streptomyces rimosus TaxID=1927 RepID=UPI0004CA283E|nr:hypothetical protein [Streptomyces rimosus]